MLKNGKSFFPSYIKKKAFFHYKEAYYQWQRMFYHWDEDAIKILRQHPKRSLLFAVGRISAVQCKQWVAVESTNYLHPASAQFFLAPGAHSLPQREKISRWMRAGALRPCAATSPESNWSTLLKPVKLLVDGFETPADGLLVPVVLFNIYIAPYKKLKCGNWTFYDFAP